AGYRDRCFERRAIGEIHPQHGIRDAGTIVQDRSIPRRQGPVRHLLLTRQPHAVTATKGRREEVMRKRRIVPAVFFILLAANIATAEVPAWLRQAATTNAGTYGKDVPVV